MKRKLLPLVLAVAWGVSGVSWADKIGTFASEEGYKVTFHDDQKQVWAEVKNSNERVISRGMRVIGRDEYGILITEADSLVDAIRREKKRVFLEEARGLYSVCVSLEEHEQDSDSDNSIVSTVTNWLFGSKRKKN